MGDYVKVNVKGFKELGLTLRKVATNVVGASAVGQYNAAVEIIEAAKSNAPVKTGALQAGGYAEPARATSAQRVMVDYGFTGFAADRRYLLMQHEASPTHAKFFENAVNAAEARTNQLIYQAVNAYLKGGRVPPLSTDSGVLDKAGAEAASYAKGTGGAE
jgi:hypothetical protein